MVLHAHSLAEAYLYLMAASCAKCGKGPLDNARPEQQSETTEFVDLLLHASCKNCNEPTSFLFRIPVETARANPDATPIINPTGEPSTILDVGQWLMLFRIISEAAGRETDKVQSRRLGLEAALCLEEAMKFYEEDNELPPASAFFTNASRGQLRDNPDRFSKSRLINLRSKLPSTNILRANVEGRTRPHKPWWKRFGGK